MWKNVFDSVIGIFDCRNFSTIIAVYLEICRLSKSFLLFIARCLIYFDIQFFSITLPKMYGTFSKFEKCLHSLLDNSINRLFSTTLFARNGIFSTDIDWNFSTMKTSTEKIRLNNIGPLAILFCYPSEGVWVICHHPLPPWECPLSHPPYVL